MDTVDHGIRGEHDVPGIETHYRRVIADPNLARSRCTTRIDTLFDDLHQIRFADRRMGRTLVGLHTKDYIWANLRPIAAKRRIMTTVLLLSDIHGNLPALETVIDDAYRRTDITSVWVMGDSVGYGAQPNEVVERLRLLPNLAMVKGNHEAAAMGEISIINFNPSAAAAAAWTADALTTDTRDYLTSLPLVTISLGITLCHGTPRNPIWEYMLTSQTAEMNLGHFDTAGCIHGHTHIPSVFGRYVSANWHVIQARDDDVFQLEFTRWLVNPGSVGQPRDGDPRASYALLRLIDDEVPQIQFHRAEYDVAKAQDLILDAHLPSTLAYRLSVGR